MVFCEGAADARDPTPSCGKEALKLAISSSFGFCELVLRMGEMLAGWPERDAQAGANGLPIAEHVWRARRSV